MRCNNKYILEGSNEGEKLGGGLLSYANDEIKGDRHRHIASSKQVIGIDTIRKPWLFLAHKININLI